jgi:hypothetical protein
MQTAKNPVPFKRPFAAFCRQQLKHHRLSASPVLEKISKNFSPQIEAQAIFLPDY